MMRTGSGSFSWRRMSRKPDRTIKDHHGLGSHVDEIGVIDEDYQKREAAERVDRIGPAPPHAVRPQRAASRFFNFRGSHVMILPIRYALEFSNLFSFFFVLSNSLYKDSSSVFLFSGMS